MRAAILLFALIGSITPALSQLISPDELWLRVRQQHPIARQAQIMNQQAIQLLRQARGAFDPKAYAQQEQKTFDGKNYFTYGAGGLKWASPFALELKAEFNWSDGIYLNPERNLPDLGQGVLGLSLPLGQGLLVDERRTALRLAEWADEFNSAGANTLLNNLFLETNKAYWDWAWSYYALRITEDALRISSSQLEAVREGYIQGKDPAIDTLEAFLQVQNWTLERAQARLALANAETQMGVFLWSANGTPESLPSSWQPINPALSLEPINPDSLLQALDFQHPELRSYQIKLNQLQIERRWKSEQLKPQLNISYNLLGDAWRFGGQAADRDLRNLVTNNYKLGIQFEMPILLRKERAGLAMADLKIAETNWQLSQKRQELRAKLTAYTQVLNTLDQQIQLGQSIVNNYTLLLEAEQIKFSAGSSSIFLLNTRQQKLLEARLKLLKFQAEMHKTTAAIRWAAGTGV